MHRNSTKSLHKFIRLFTRFPIEPEIDGIVKELQSLPQRPFIFSSILNRSLKLSKVRILMISELILLSHKLLKSKVETDANLKKSVVIFYQ